MYIPKFYSSRTVWIIFFKIKATVSLSHQSLYFLVIFWISLAPGIKTTLSKLSNFFFFTCFGGKIAKYGGKKSAWKQEKKKYKSLQSQSADLLYLRKKETTLLEADVDTVAVIEDGKSLVEPLQLQRGIDGS